MSDVISKKQLEEGFKKQTEQIEDLISAAQTEYDAKIYTVSIALSFLAFEEITKLRKIRDSDVLNGEMSLKEWRELTQGPGVHYKKIKKPIEDKIKHRQTKDNEHWNLVKDFVDKTLMDAGGQKMSRVDSTYDPEMVYAINEVKMSCLYLDFKNNNWVSAKTILSQKELKAIAYVNLKMAEYNLTEVLLHNKHREISVDDTSASYQNYINDPLFKKRVEFQKLSQSNKFQIQHIIARSAISKFKKNRKNDKKHA